VVTKLHQILAVESGVRTQAQKDLTAAHHGLQKAEMISGYQKSYEPLKEDGDKLPTEGKLLQTRVPDVIRGTAAILERMYDVTATRDYGTSRARADVVVDGAVLLKDVPVTFLLWLEKKLEDLHTFVTQLPTLPADTEWTWDAAQNCWKNRHEIKRARTNKIVYPLVLYEATKEHPAPVKEITKDEVVGYFTEILYNGGLQMQDVKNLKERVEKLQESVKFAREKANELEIVDQKVGGTLLRYVFGGTP